MGKIRSFDRVFLSYCDTPKESTPQPERVNQYLNSNLSELELFYEINHSGLITRPNKFMIMVHESTTIILFEDIKLAEFTNKTDEQLHLVMRKTLMTFLERGTAVEYRKTVNSRIEALLRNCEYQSMTYCYILHIIMCSILDATYTIDILPITSSVRFVRHNVRKITPKNVRSVRNYVAIMYNGTRFDLVSSQLKSLEFRLLAFTYAINKGFSEFVEPEMFRIKVAKAK